VGSPPNPGVSPLHGDHVLFGSKHGTKKSNNKKSVEIIRVFYLKKRTDISKYC
jgi:hypothetical protein